MCCSVFSGVHMGRMDFTDILMVSRCFGQCHSDVCIDCSSNGLRIRMPCMDSAYLHAINVLEIWCWKYFVVWASNNNIFLQEILYKVKKM